MAITTKLQTKYALQRLFMILVCLGMGLWGVYDYVVKIPGQQRAFDRGQICREVKNVLEAAPGATDAARKLGEVQASVDGELQALLDLGLEDRVDPEELKQAIETVRAKNDENWMKFLLVFREGLRHAQQRSPDGAPDQRAALAHQLAERGVNQTANVTPPSKFDRATQWAFMLSLPFVPYFLWGFLRTRRRVYRLDEEGSLHFPGGTWSKDEIADVDMSRWMAKSVAFVQHTGGERLKLDDYVYRNVHLIVGALASERYPESWEEDGRQKKHEEEAADHEEAAGEHDDAETTAPETAEA